MNDTQLLVRMKEILVNDMGIDENIIKNMTQQELDKFCMENGCMLCCI